MAKFISAGCLMMMFPALALLFFGIYLSNEKIQDYGNSDYWVWSGVIVAVLATIVQVIVYFPQWLAKDWNEGD